MGPSTEGAELESHRRVVGEERPLLLGEQPADGPLATYGFEDPGTLGQSLARTRADVFARHHVHLDPDGLADAQGVSRGLALRRLLGASGSGARAAGPAPTGRLSRDDLLGLVEE
jgi:hypothetical protein